MSTQYLYNPPAEPTKPDQEVPQPLSLVELSDHIDAKLNEPASIEAPAHLFARLVEFDARVQSRAEESTSKDSSSPTSLKSIASNNVLQQHIKGGIPSLEVDFQTGVSSALLDMLPYDTRVVLDLEGTLVQIHLPQDRDGSLYWYAKAKEGKSFFIEACPQAGAAGIDEHFRVFLDTDAPQQSFADKHILNDEIERITSTFTRAGEHIELEIHRTIIVKTHT